MRILLTGANGFVGRHAARAFSEAGDEVIAASGPAADDSQEPQFDITDAKAVERVVAEARPDAILHLAGFSSVGKSHASPSRAFAVNTLGTVNLLQAARALGTGPRVLVVSSGEVYGNAAGPAKATESTPLAPESPYGASKVAAEVACQQFARGYRLPVVIARPFNHLGAGQDRGFVVPSFARQALAIARGGEPVISVGDLSPVRDFSHVDDVVAAYRLLLEKGEPGQAYNIGSGAGRSIRSVLDELLALAKVNAEVRVDPARLRPAEIPSLVADASRLRSLGWMPRKTVADALQDVLAEATSQP